MSRLLCADCAQPYRSGGAILPAADGLPVRHVCQDCWDRRLLARLTDDQRARRACAECGRSGQPMVVVQVRTAQLAICSDRIACTAAAEQLPGGAPDCPPPGGEE